MFSATAPSSKRLVYLTLAGVALLVVAGIAAWWYVFTWGEEKQAKLPPFPDDPRTKTDSPYRNVRPEVQYVGTAACSDCHGDIVKRYALHPMGRSLEAMDAYPDEDLRAETRNPFTAQGFEYIVEKKGKSTIHHEIKKDSDGRVIYDFARPISHVVGSSTRGKSYLWQLEGRVYQSPISWYSSKSRWGLSPGYERRNHHFERVILPECLFCHANGVEPVENRVNQYHAPMFRGHAIGCERCHGPGELHIKQQPQPKGQEIDPTIVNPGKLAARLRDAVCEQCHLQGEARVARLGRSIFDYRPGMALEDFFVLFVRPERLMDYARSVGQVEQMRVSECYIQSEGKLGCISCHDPHESPAPAHKVEFFRSRCQKCHGPVNKDCALPLANRNRTKPGNNCIVCHMPREKGNVVHTSVTDHRVLRKPAEAPAFQPGKLSPDDVPLRAFHDSPGNPLETRREMAVALARLAGSRGMWPPARLALPVLSGAVKKYPQDTDVLDSLVTAHQVLGQNAEAKERLTQLLEYAPDREGALSLAINVYSDEPGRAQKYCEKLVAINPYSSEYRYQLGQVHQRQKHWARSIEALEQAMKLNPARVDVRRALVYALVQQKEWERAQRELKDYQAFAPRDLDEVRGWLKR